MTRLCICTPLAAVLALVGAGCFTAHVDSAVLDSGADATATRDAGFDSGEDAGPGESVDAGVDASLLDAGPPDAGPTCARLACFPAVDISIGSPGADHLYSAPAVVAEADGTVHVMFGTDTPRAGHLWTRRPDGASTRAALPFTPRIGALALCDDNSLVASAESFERADGELWRLATASAPASMEFVGTVRFGASSIACASGTIEALGGPWLTGLGGPMRVTRPPADAFRLLDGTSPMDDVALVLDPGGAPEYVWTSGPIDSAEVRWARDDVPSEALPFTLQWPSEDYTRVAFRLAVDMMGRSHLLLRSGMELIYAVRGASGGWTVQRLASTCLPGDCLWTVQPIAVLISPAGDVALVWSRIDFAPGGFPAVSGELVLALADDTGVHPTVLSSTFLARLGTAAFDAGGSLHVAAWTGRASPGPNEIRYARFDP